MYSAGKYIYQYDNVSLAIYMIYLSLHVNASYTTELVAMASYHLQGKYRLGDHY